MEIKKIIAIVLAVVLLVGGIAFCAASVTHKINAAETAVIETTVPTSEFEAAKLEMYYDIYRTVFEDADEDEDVTLNYIEVEYRNDDEAFYIHLSVDCLDTSYGPRNCEAEMLLPYNKDNYRDFDDSGDLVDEDNAIMWMERYTTIDIN